MSSASPQGMGNGMFAWIGGLALLIGVAVVLGLLGTSSIAQPASTSDAAEPGGVQASTTLPADAVKVFKPGTGATPGPTDTVTVRYVGRLAANGQVFDATPPGQTADFPLDKVVPGFSQGIQRMHVGEQARITIPAALGYPEGTPDGAIPPGSTIVFDVELVKIAKAQ